MQQPYCRLFIVAAVIIAQMAGWIGHADILPSAFLETAIPDADPTGVLLSFSPAPPIASVDQLSLTISHEWLGDLTVKLITPSGEEFILFERLQLAESPPDGSSAILGGFVFEGNRGVLVPRSYHFARVGANLEAAAQLAVETQLAPVVPPDTLYAAQSWQEGPFLAGDWKILLSDAAEFSNGVIQSAELFYTAVPEPGIVALWLVGLGSIAIGWRRPRSSSKNQRSARIMTRR